MLGNQIQVNEFNTILIITEESNEITSESENVQLVVNENNVARLTIPQDNVKILSVAIQGPAGPPGSGGGGGGSDAHYVHNQLVASSSWSIVHGLNKKPSVTIVDSGDTVVVGDVDYTDNNSLVVTFAAPFGGKAYLN